MRFIKYNSINYSNYKNSSSLICYPKNDNEIFKVIDFALKKKISILPIGNSYSWFDTIHSTKNLLLNLKKYKKKFRINKKKNYIELTSNYTIREILKIISERGYTISSLPGIYDVTIGGCIGNDVHGKDSFKKGNFSSNILEIEIIIANKKIIKCSSNKNKEIFRSICGGLGLIGIVTKAKIKITKKHEFFKTEILRCKNYKEIIHNIYNNRENYENIHGWIDNWATKSNIGRGILFKSIPINNSETVFQKTFLEMKFLNSTKNFIYKVFINFNLMKYFNILIWKFLFLSKSKISTYENITFPLNDYIDLKKVIKPKSFIEIQAILREETLVKDFKIFLLKCQKLKINGYLSGIKLHKKNNNYLSFADNGISVNINEIFTTHNKKKVFDKFQKLHDYLIKKKIKVYIGKDFLLKERDLIKSNSRSYGIWDELGGRFK